MSGRAVAYDVVKRALDIVAALVALVLTFPVQLVVAGLVAVRLGRPVLFRHPRPGKSGEVFTLLKFRTMLPLDAEQAQVTDEQRLTPFGRKLRATSLDELPSLFNVLAGSMSVVGPRPLNVRYLERYSPEQRRRHEVRPGITGLAQVNGRNNLDWPTRLVLDVQYVDQRSLLLDARIVLRTVWLVLSREGISQEGHATAQEFMGTESTKGDS